MPKPQQSGHFQFCVDLGLGSDQTALAQHRELAEMTQQLLRLFDDHQLSVTWAAPLAMVSRVADVVRDASAPHELALLGDANWIGDSIRRASVVESIEDHLDAVRREKIHVTTIVLRDDQGAVHYDLLAKHGIGIMRAPVADGVTRHTSRDPVAARKGTWLVSATACFPATGMILGRHDIGFRGKQILSRSLRRRASEHLAVSAAEMIQHPKAIKSLTQIVRHAVRLQRAGRLRCETLQQAVARWQPTKRQSPGPQRSILRPAA